MTGPKGDKGDKGKGIQGTKVMRGRRVILVVRGHKE